MALILVVDDDSDSRQVTELYLTKAGHQVQAVANGRIALVALRTVVPDVVILDARMPEMDGVEFLRVMQGYLRWQKLPVIVVTAYPQGPHIDELRAMGVKAILTKGQFELAELAICVNLVAQDPDASCQVG